MKKIVIIFLLFSSFFYATDYINDEPDFYVQGNDLNNALKVINLYTCFVGNGIARGGLLNKGPYKVLTNDDLCVNRFSESASSTDSSKVAKSVDSETDQNNSDFKNLVYNQAIFDVKKASQTAPLTAQIWYKYNHGSTNPSKLPQNIYYDFEITKLACTEDRVANNIPCSKYGDLKLNYSYQPADNSWDELIPVYGNLGLGTAGVTAGMGAIEIEDNTIKYYANAGQATYNTSLTHEGTISKGVFEKFRSITNSWPWAIGYRFYQDTSKKLFCQKYDYAFMLAYVDPYLPGDPSHGSSYHAFTNLANKAGPKRVTNPKTELSGDIPITNMTEHVRTALINPGYEINESCFSLEGLESKKIVDYYGVYDSNGSRIDLQNKAFPIKATASGENDFPGGFMFAYANEWGVWLDPSYKSFFDENTIWKNSNPNATDLQKAKSYTLKSNPIVVNKITIDYIALNDIHKHELQMWVYDEYWNTEYKNLGFCGIEGRDKDGVSCNFYRDYVGYYDKDLNGVDGDAGSVGGFVFNKYYDCGATGCSSGTLSGSDIIKFENSQWISTMAKTYGSYTHVRDLHAWNRSAGNHMHIRKTTIQNPSSTTSTNGIRQEKHQIVSLNDMPTTLYCIANCISPAALNTSYQNLLIDGQNIANDSNQSWDKTSISGNTDRAPRTSPFFDVGPYIKTSEVNGSGALEFDWNRDSTVDSTRSNAAGGHWDGIRDSQKIKYIVDGNKIYAGSVSEANSLTFNSTNKATLNNIKNIGSFLNGAKIQRQDNRIEYVGWGLWGGRLMTQAQLNNAECDKSFNDFSNSNDEYQYRPGWNQAQSEEKRYCTNKFYQGNVTEYYTITFRTEPTYNLMDGNAVVTFDKPKNLMFTIPNNANYPEYFRGQKYRLQFTGDGNRLNGLPMERYDLATGNTVENAATWLPTHRWVDSFVIQDGEQVTDIETNEVYTLKGLRGQIYLKPIPVNTAVSLIGGGEVAIPYDMEATIPSTSLIKDISPNNGSTTNTIGSEPTNILNDGNPCVTDGVKNLSDKEGCPFWSWSISN